MFKKKVAKKKLKQNENNDELNELNKRHLEFYEEKVKQLEEQPPRSDKAHEVIKESQSKWRRKREKKKGKSKKIGT